MTDGTDIWALRWLLLRKLRLSEIGQSGCYLKEGVLNNAYRFVNALSLLEASPEADEISYTPYGNIVIDLMSRRGEISIEIGTHKLGFFTDFTGYVKLNLRESGCDNILSVDVEFDYEQLYINCGEDSFASKTDVYIERLQEFNRQCDLVRKYLANWIEVNLGTK